MVNPLFTSDLDRSVPQQEVKSAAEMPHASLAGEFGHNSGESLAIAYLIAVLAFPY